MKLALFAVYSLVFAIVQPVFSQSVVITQEINLPKDSTIKKRLTEALSRFIAQKDNPIKENKYVLPDDALAIKMLLAELKGAEKNAALKEDNFYRPYLVNIAGNDGINYRLQINYMGINGSTPVLKTSFRLMAKLMNGQFYFYSPLKDATRYWKTKKIGHITFHFKDTLNIDGAKYFEKTVRYYDGKLTVPAIKTDDYYCDNFNEAMQLIGLDYKLEYNGLANDNLATRDGNAFLIVNGWNSPGHRFDTHDLWHERLRLVAKAETINRPVDEGCAYLYGGSWEVYNWTDILAGFKKYAAENPNADWLTMFVNEKNKNFVDGQKPLKISYVINALIVQKLERERGFAPVMELLTCGKFEAGDKNYFKALEKVAGINMGNFNAEVWKLIRQ